MSIAEFPSLMRPVIGRLLDAASAGGLLVEFNAQHKRVVHLRGERITRAFFNEPDISYKITHSLVIATVVCDGNDLFVIDTGGRETMVHLDDPLFSYRVSQAINIGSVLINAPYRIDPWD